MNLSRTQPGPPSWVGGPENQRRRREFAEACSAGNSEEEQFDDEDGDDIDHLDHGVDGGSGGILVGIADGVAGDRGLVGVAVFAAVVAFLDELLGIVPCAAG